MKTDEKFMALALKEAEKARKIDEVPVGAVIVLNGEVIARAYNKREQNNDPLGHAEIRAIKKASKKLNNWRLVDCELYVTLEPCLMCTGAIINSRIKRVIYGTSDPKGGAIESSLNLMDIKNINHYPEITKNVLQKECSEILKNYFKNKRK